jgi:hypothetical protein
MAFEIREENLNTGQLLVDSKYLLKLAGIFQTNAFTIYNEDETQDIGCGIYIQASIFDHSCKPSAVFSSKGDVCCKELSIVKITHLKIIF